MSRLPPDITLDPAWQQEQADRLLGFEVLNNILHARYQPMDPERLADKIGADKGYSFMVVKNIKRALENG